MAKQKVQNNKVYKIRRRSDGLFSTGGNYIRFEERGKTWSSLSALSSHLTNTLGSSFLNCLDDDNEIIVEKFFNTRNPYLDCEIIESELKFEVLDDVYRYHATRKIRGKKNAVQNSKE
jgi:hypothetical protein